MTIVRVMAHFGGWFRQFFVHFLLYIHAFAYLQLKDKIQIELKSHFNIKIETEDALHLKLFSHIEMRYKYPTYSISPAKVK